MPLIWTDDLDLVHSEHVRSGAAGGDGVDWGTEIQYCAMEPGMRDEIILV
jgi:hypothetical protein